MAKLPPTSQDDVTVVEYLAKQHKVCVIPGSACGLPGFIRVCYSNLAPEACQEAADASVEDCPLSPPQADPPQMLIAAR
eukprot:CAMPEP_0196744208 /NCGR_PEP_ID=MMETSP1091-20130531/56397_1 /TAXON_ID=302021 /ORGANISM="Rhodomonas sp., Strain CCMP768" /LENGTH=78 /DNA_ID=CAMNT_0042090705 /DNA_START=33 /DNA_END=270 /DNA_ORIENTATION=+